MISPDVASRSGVFQDLQSRDPGRTGLKSLKRPAARGTEAKRQDRGGGRGGNNWRRTDGEIHRTRPGPRIAALAAPAPLHQAHRHVTAGGPTTAASTMARPASTEVDNGERTASRPRRARERDPRKRRRAAVPSRPSPYFLIGTNRGLIGRLSIPSCNLQPLAATSPTSRRLVTGTYVVRAALCPRGTARWLPSRTSGSLGRPEHLHLGLAPSGTRFGAACQDCGAERSRSCHRVEAGLDRPPVPDGRLDLLRSQQRRRARAPFDDPAAGPSSSFSTQSALRTRS